MKKMLWCFWGTILWVLCIGCIPDWVDFYTSINPNSLVKWIYFIFLAFIDLVQNFSYVFCNLMFLIHCIFLEAVVKFFIYELNHSKEEKIEYHIQRFSEIRACIEKYSQKWQFSVVLVMILTSAQIIFFCRTKYSNLFQMCKFKK